MVATPLGNLGDLSPRASECLSSVPILLAEDSKRAGIACARWGIKVHKIRNLHEHNEAQKLVPLIQELKEGTDMALISDAGMPVLSDPGYLLVQACRKEGITVTVIPGPCAPVTALAGSGIAPQPFVFLGFLPRKRNDKEKSLAPYAQLAVTLIFFERKDRIAQTLQEMYTLFGRREVCIARELTKIHEEYIHFYLDDVPDLSQLLGEITVIIGQPLEKIRTDESFIMQCINEERMLGGTLRDVARRVQVKSLGWSNSEIYALASRK